MSENTKTIHAGNKGLANLGNTCYMNSALQCLSHLTTFHPNNENFFKECKRTDKNSLLYEWFQFQRKMWSNEDNSMINPIILLKTFQAKCIEKDLYFSNFMQNDIDEFLTLFLDLLHQGVGRKVEMTFSDKIEDEADKINLKSNQTWQRFYEKDYSYIVENFYSQLLGITSCTDCEYYTTNHDPIQVLSLEIPQEAESLDCCLKEYMKKYRLDEGEEWKCDECKNQVRPFKQTRLWKTSDVLFILLKRYNQNKKIDKYLEYPLTLDLQDYNINYSKNKSNKYKLNSFAIHSGSLSGGHYYAVCKNYLDGKWSEYNDSNVSRVSRDTVTKYSPYLLVYKRL
jgi:ubiquitin carboxyl-terminal hydrolase 2/21